MSSGRRSPRQRQHDTPTPTADRNTRGTPPQKNDGRGHAAEGRPVMDAKITHLRPGWAIYEEAGHTAEGALTVTEDGVNFDGHLICGPHDELGNHTNPVATEVPRRT